MDSENEQTVNNSLNGLKDLGRSVVESYASEDGSVWWLRFNDGLIEQGGITPNIGADSGYHVNFPIPFQRKCFGVNLFRSSATGRYTPTVSNVSLIGMRIFNNNDQGGSQRLTWSIKGY